MPTRARPNVRTLAPGGTMAGRAGCAALLALLALPATAQTAPPAAISVSVRPAKARCFTETVQLTGHLEPRERVDVGPDREGLKVAQILVAPLDVVQAGQPLARLAPLEGPDTGGTTVSAPVSGTVLQSRGTVGQPVSPRQGPLFQIVARGEIDLAAQAPLAVQSRIEVGQLVTVRPLGGPERAGRVRLIDPGTDAGSQAGRVRITLGPGPEARIGTFARGLVTIERRCGLGVPYSAVQYGPEGTVVQVVDRGRIETRQVTVGLLNDAEAEIRSGLSEADHVVVRAGPFVREGDRVEAIVQP